MLPSAGAVAAALARHTAAAARSASCSLFVVLVIGSSFVGRLHVGLHTNNAVASRALHLVAYPRILDVMSGPKRLAEESTAPIATLLENHRVFLRYLERRVGNAPSWRKTFFRTPSSN